jgi:excinuclease ABC subunit A
VIEHDRSVIERCDRVVELGPGAGPNGGQLLFSGTPAELAKTKTATARAWKRSGAEGARRRTPKRWLHITGARENNLDVDDVRIPLGVLCAITGPSGSGKSTLAEDIVYRAVARATGGASSIAKAGVFDTITGIENVKAAVLVDQSPLGRTARGNAATYTKAWDSVRKRLAAEPAAGVRGLTASSFSFNVEGGRCDACSGEGFETVEMQFLADVRLVCPVCRGQRFRDGELSVEALGLGEAEGPDLGFSVGNGSNGLTPDVSTIYIDDAAISTVRLGAQ